MLCYNVILALQIRRFSQYIPGNFTEMCSYNAAISEDYIKMIYFNMCQLMFLYTKMAVILPKAWTIKVTSIKRIFDLLVLKYWRYWSHYRYLLVVTLTKNIYSQLVITLAKIAAALTVILKNIWSGKFLSSFYSKDNF